MMERNRGSTVPRPWDFRRSGARGSAWSLQPTLAVGKGWDDFDIGHDLKFTTGIGYQFALAPDHRARPLTPAYAGGLIVTTRINF